MMQEGAIHGWMDTIDQKKKIIKDKENRCDKLEEENGGLVSKNAEQHKRVKSLELELASANALRIEKEGEIIGLKRLLESQAVQKE